MAFDAILVKKDTFQVLFDLLFVTFAGLGAEAV